MWNRRIKECIEEEKDFQNVWAGGGEAVQGPAQDSAEGFQGRQGCDVCCQGQGVVCFFMILYAN